MLNYFRAQMFRLVKTKSFYWITLALILLLIGATLVQNNLFSTGEASAEGVGITVHVDQSSIDWLNENMKVNLTTFAAETAVGEFNSLFIALFTAMFFAAPYRHGYIKNYFGQWPNRAPLVLTDLIILLLGTLWYTVIGCLTTFAAGYLIFGPERCFIGALGATAPQAIATMFLLNFAFGTLVYFIVTLTRSMAGALTGGIVLSLGATSISTLIDVIGHMISKDLTLSNYTVCGNLTNVFLDSPVDQLSRASIVGAVAVVLFAALSVLVMQKRDLS